MNEQDAREQYEEMESRQRLRTEYDPADFVNAYEAADYETKADLRRLLKELDSGRFYAMLDASHNVLARSDLKRRRMFTAQYSDHLIRWIKAFGTVEDLNTFPDIEANDYPETETEA